MDAFLAELAKTLATVGPVGAFALGGWLLWLKYGRPQNHRPANDRSHPPTPNGGNQQSLTATRDMIRDTEFRTTRIERNTEQEIDHLSTLVAATAHLAEVMERIESRQISAEDDRRRNGEDQRRRTDERQRDREQRARDRDRERREPPKPT